MENSMEVPQQIKEPPYDLEIPRLGIYLKKMNALMQKDICIPMFIKPLFTTAKTCRQQMCPSVDGWIKKM